MFDGKMKALTFSYDDGVTQDIRLAELFHKYGLKATFNLNSEYLGTDGRLLREGVQVSHKKVLPADVRHVYEGHEIAGHTLTHPRLPELADDAEVIRQVEQDRLKLSELAGYEVVGFAYPCGGVNHDARVERLIAEQTGVRYARTIESSHSFDLQVDLIKFQPTVYHHREFNEMLRLGEKFLSLTPDKPQIFYVWGHAYEFDIRDDWARFEEFCQMMSGRNDIFYGTNREVLLTGGGQED
ncbi:MAG: polysaccharide deacetylase family protein [Clostridia bacterium]|nr:polysaccharide deacetylase family protein [Clostridia bacterium]